MARITNPWSVAFLIFALKLLIDLNHNKVPDEFEEKQSPNKSDKGGEI